MEPYLVRIVKHDAEEHGEIVIFPSLEDAIDSMFANAYPSLKIKPFKEYLKDANAREKVERADEYKAYEKVKEILSSKVENSRICFRLYNGSSSVLLDNKVKKSICRFYFRHVKKKYITILGSSGEHEKIFIEKWEDIIFYAKELMEALNMRILSDAAGTVKAAMA